VTVRKIKTARTRIAVSKAISLLYLIVLFFYPDRVIDNQSGVVRLLAHRTRRALVKVAAFIVATERFTS